MAGTALLALSAITTTTGVVQSHKAGKKRDDDVKDAQKREKQAAEMEAAKAEERALGKQSGGYASTLGKSSKLGI